MRKRPDMTKVWKVCALGGQGCLKPTPGAPQGLTSAPRVKKNKTFASHFVQMRSKLKGGACKYAHSLEGKVRKYDQSLKGKPCNYDQSVEGKARKYDQSLKGKVRKYDQSLKR